MYLQSKYDVYYETTYISKFEPLKKLKSALYFPKRVFFNFKAIDQLYRVTSVNTIIICKVNKKIISKMVFWYQTGVNERDKKVCLIPKIYFSYRFLNNLQYNNFNYRRTWPG